MSCDVGEMTERLENEQSYLQMSRAIYKWAELIYIYKWAELILQPFRMGGSPGDVSENPVT